MKNIIITLIINLFFTFSFFSQNFSQDSINMCEVDSVIIDDTIKLSRVEFETFCYNQLIRDIGDLLDSEKIIYSEAVSCFVSEKPNKDKISFKGDIITNLPKNYKIIYKIK
jgi:hypothetical protein